METKNSNICCGFFEKYAKTFKWMTRYDENKNKIYLMPHIGELRYRINNCPTCGAEIRGIELTQKQFNCCK